MRRSIRVVGWRRGGTLTLRRRGDNRLVVTVVRGINKQRLNVIVERRRLTEALGKV